VFARFARRKKLRGIDQKEVLVKWCELVVGRGHSSKITFWEGECRGSWRGLKVAKKKKESSQPSTELGVGDFNALRLGGMARCIKKDGFIEKEERGKLPRESIGRLNYPQFSAQVGNAGEKGLTFVRKSSLRKKSPQK